MNTGTKGASSALVAAEGPVGGADRGEGGVAEEAGSGRAHRDSMSRPAHSVARQRQAMRSEEWVDMKCCRMGRMAAAGQSTQHGARHEA